MFSGLESIWHSLKALMASASWRQGLLILLVFEFCIGLAFFGLYGAVSYQVERDHYRLLQDRFVMIKPPNSSVLASQLADRLRMDVNRPIHQNFRYQITDDQGRVLFSDMPTDFSTGRPFFPLVRVMWIDDDFIHPYINDERRDKRHKRGHNKGHKRNTPPIINCDDDDDDCETIGPLGSKAKHWDIDFDVALISSSWKVPKGVATVAVFSFGYGLFLEVLLRWLGILLVVTTILGLLLTGWQARRTLVRIDRIRALADAIMAGDLGARLPTTKGRTSRKPNEYDRLRDSLNAMLDKINEGIDAVKSVSDHIAHDLRTPLSILRNRVEQIGKTEEAPEQLRNELTAQIDKILQIFQALINLTRLEKGAIRMDLQPIDMEQLSDNLLDLYEPLAEDRNISLSCTLAAPVSIIADGHQLFQALANIVDNALKFTPDGGKVTVVISAISHDGENILSIVIDDSGPGIMPKDRARAFDRYIRLDSDIGGSGLGLTLARAVILAHKGTIGLQQSALGGLQVTICLPNTL